ncbi:MAG: ABC transporter ATP-binding protein [Planctomycetes bacterium]|nr:ABC transporter ATP-binding protein [Planctomycetota bacterium]
MTPVLEARDVVKRYGDAVAVAGVSFHVRPGECYGLLGPNGAGKTTLFKLVTAFARRDGGALTVFGLDPGASPSALKARLGVVGQEDDLDADLDVVSNLRVHGGFFGLGGPALEARIDRLLAFLELGERRRAPIMALSGGMKRRLAIVRALLNAPELLLLDEPTTGLDPQIRHAIWNALRALKAEGLTLLLTTHYMEEAAQLADRVGILERGRLIAEGPPEALVREHLPRFVLELPRSRQQDDGWRELARDVRLTEEHGDRVYLFHDDEGPLRRFQAERALQGAQLRHASLEDVFLKLTGRSLDA